MESANGGSDAEHLENREWILRCEGFTVVRADGRVVGTIAEVVYDHSTRWDRPSGLNVRAAHSTLSVPLDAIERVEEGRVWLRAPGA